jgi:hypothetical protein
MHFRNTYHLLFLSLLSVTLLSCARTETNEERNPAFAEREPYPSPFAQKRVQLSTESFSKPATASEVPTTNAGLKIVMIAKNDCIDRQCASSPTSPSCLLVNHAERKRDLQTQFFPVKLTKQLSETELNQWISADSCIVGISNNQEYKTEVLDDPYYLSHQKTYLDTVKFQTSLARFKPEDLSPVRVAVIDTGIATHPDFGDAAALPGVIHREDLRSTSSKEAPECASKPFSLAQPNHPHGTMVSGVIGATAGNATGTAGIASNAQLLSFAVGNCNGQMSTTEIGNALLAASQRQAEVVNLSLGGRTGDDPAVRFSLIQLLNAKAVIVVAAGNSYLDLSAASFYPATYAAQYPGIITVAWGTPTGEIQLGNQVNQGSNYSPQHVKILAPGEMHAVPTLANGYATGIRGSSLSTPVVAGAVALTIGFLKKKGLSYDESMVDYLITRNTSEKRNSLVSYVRDGAVLDMDKLGQALQNLVLTGNQPAPIVADQVSLTYNESLKQQQLQMRLNWDLISTHFGARLGIFDARCGYSAACLIQDFVLPANKGSQQIRLSRNDLLPTLPNQSDPALALYISAAIYYKVVNADGTAKPNFGTDAIFRFNLRDQDGSDNASPLYSGVTNIRTDQQYLYVQGFVCQENSNKAVPVQIIDAANNAVIADFAYNYSLMVPHSTPVDSSMAFGPGNFLAFGFAMKQLQKPAFVAGLEANPEDILPCHTLTVAHGFEFGVKLKDIVTGNRQGTKFRVRATNPRTNAMVLLKDKLGNEQFSFPDVNLQTRPPTVVNVSRSGDNIGITGSICSQSPTPVQMEVSFSQWSFRCTVKNKTPFPDLTDPCGLGNYMPLPLLFDPSLTDRQKFRHVYFWSPGFNEPVYDLSLTPLELAKHQQVYPTRWPNASVSGSTNANATFLNYLASKQFREVGSNSIVGGFQNGDFTVATRGPANTAITSANLANRAGTSVLPIFRYLAQYWDYYDVGEEYTDSVIAYDIDITKTIGEYLFRTLGVRKLMRETKKYETPMGLGSTFLTYNSIPKGTAEGGACGYRFPLSSTVNQISRYNPFVSEYQIAVLRQGESPQSRFNFTQTMAATMQRIPLDIRFFQDGTMILHLLTDYNSGTTPLPTLGRGL